MQARFKPPLIAIAMPLLLFIAFGGAMMHLTGRDQFPATAAAVSEPLNFRIGGYDSTAAIAYWDWLGPEGRRAEQRFLAADLVFPLIYGVALFASLLLLWNAAARPFNRAWLAAPVVITIIADWVENLMHLRQLARFVQGHSVQDAWMQLATLATTAKLSFFWITTVLILALCARVLASAPRSP